MSCHYGDISGFQKRKLQNTTRRPSSFSHNAGSARSMILGLVMVSLVALFAGAPFMYQSLRDVSEVQAQELPVTVLSSQQSVISDVMNRMFQVNIPSNFRELVTMVALEVEGESIFGGEVSFSNEVLFDGQITLQGDVFGNGVNLNLSSGQITASNILYSVKAGDGISISDGQTPTISNNDRGSAQNIFKKVKVGSDESEADSNSDTLEIASGTGISLSIDKDNDKITISNSLTPGFIQSGSYAILPSGITSVGIGTDTPGNTVEINSGSSNTSGLSFTQLTSSSPVGVGGGKVLSLDSGGRVILVEDQTSTDSAETILPSTTAGGTLYFNGVDWVGSTNLYHDGGSVGISNDNPISRLHVNSNLATKIGLIIQGYTAQSANLQEWRDGSGNILSYIDQNGVFNGEANVEGDINPGLTTGSVLFQSASGIAQDNANFFWDDSANRLGLGTTSPAALLSVGSGSLFQVNTSGAIASIGGVAHTLTNSSGALLITSNGLLRFDDSNLSSSLPLTLADTSLNAGLTQGLVDALNDLYGMATTGGGSSIWSLSGSSIFPTTLANNVGIGINNPSGKLHIKNTTGGITNSIISLDTTINANASGGLEIYRGAGGVATQNSKLVMAGYAGNYLTNAATGDTVLSTNSSTNILFGNSTTGAEYMRVNSSGNVGIGTSSPQRRLHVGSAANEDVYLRVSGAINNNEGLDIWHSYGGGDIYFDSRYAHANGDFFFRTQTAGTPVNALTIKGSGNVGIGTTDPSVALHVVSTTETLRIGYDASNYTSMRTDSTGNFYIDPTNAGNAIYFGTGALAIQGNNTPQINATNANIIMQNATFNGTSSSINSLSVQPSVTPTSGTLVQNTLALLPTINQTGGANGITRGLYINPTLTAAADWRALEIANNSGYALYQSGSSALNYLAGNVGIGQTNPQVKLHVGSTAIADATALLRLQDADSQCDFTANNGSPSCGSDLTLKKNVNTLDSNSLLTKVAALRPVSYNWNTDGETSPLQFGFIAQEVAAQFPELVTDGIWNDGTTRKFLNMGGLMPYVVGAISQQQVQIAGLQAGSHYDIAFQEWLALQEITGFARWNLDTWNFMAEVVFERPVRFLQNVEFLADLNIGGRTIHGDRDTAGVAKVQSGSLEMVITFERPYSIKPIVTLTPEGESPDYYLQNVNENGFTIVLTQSADHDISFNWNVTATKTLRQDTSGAPSAGPSPTPTPVVSPDPTPSHAPVLSPSPSPSPTPSPEGEGSPSADLQE